MPLFFSSNNKKSQIQQALDYIAEATNKIASEELELNKAIQGSQRKIMPVESANLMGKVLSIDSYKRIDSVGDDVRYKSGYYTKENNVEMTCQLALTHADFLLTKSKVIHESNAVALENNTLLVDAIKKIMTSIGIPSSYTSYDYTNSSGRRVQKRQEHTNYAGYLGDLSRSVKTEDGFSSAESQHKTFLKNIEDYKQRELKKEQDANRAKEAEEQAKEDTKVLATLVVKYNLDYSSTWNHVLEEILTKDKYLELGYWLERQRNSWADGFWKAQEGIQGFKVETETDKEIYDEITSLLEDCDDGRVFRDCRYNYSTLYSMMKDENLYNDFRLAFDKVELD